MKRMHVFISGRVQGVAFRHYTAKTARSLNLGGWVRNLDDGRVEAVFEGDDASVDAMLAWFWKGTSLSRVTHVDTQEEPFSAQYEDFKIRY
ncbi:MAG: acylphosphatase [Syntrophus sp. (in: bacteria)]|nr:acylphosphatase [Syntrophus sp. (in: bacteria)]